MKLVKRILTLAVIGALLFAAMQLAGPMLNVKSSGIPYRTDVVTRGTIAQTITATGSISPEEMVNVGTQVSGKITAMYAKLNDRVVKGQLLAEVDPALPLEQLKQSKNNLETAELAYTLAQRDYDRTKALVAKDYIAKVDLERALQNVVSARVSLESAKIAVKRDEINLSYTKVTAPIDGIIIKQEVSSGQTLASNFQTPNLFVIAKDMSVMKIDMNVPESDISKIRKGMPVNFNVDAFPDRAFTGQVDTIDLNPNNQSGVVTYNVVVKLDNKEGLLFPGMTANISITLSEVKDVLRVPASALRFTPPKEGMGALARVLGSLRGNSDTSSGNGEYTGLRIYLWKNNELVMLPVYVGVSDDLYVEVRSDQLKEGDTVVTGLKVEAE